MHECRPFHVEIDDDGWNGNRNASEHDASVVLKQAITSSLLLCLPDLRLDLYHHTTHHHQHMTSLKSDLLDNPSLFVDKTVTRKAV